MDKIYRDFMDILKFSDILSPSFLLKWKAPPCDWAIEVNGPLEQGGNCTRILNQGTTCTWVVKTRRMHSDRRLPLDTSGTLHVEASFNLKQ